MRYLNCYLIIPFAACCLFASVLVLKANESAAPNAAVEVDAEKAEEITAANRADQHMTIDHLMAAGLRK